jgi:hypothetical protein
MSTQVRIKFDDGINEYIFPIVQSVSDPAPGNKATVIHGTRGDGCIIIPSGKKSIEITIRGVIVDNDGYVDITSKMNEMRTKVSTNVATLSMQHFDGGWVNDWQYTVRRIDEITFSDSLRTVDQEYEVRFLVLSY